MLENENILGALGAVIMLTIISLATALALKIQRLKQLQSLIDKLKKSLDEMDEQAKLIVRTDMELNKTQEELDKKITGLYALQRLSREISTTLEKDQIFKRINAGYLQDIGFEKALALLWRKHEKKFALSLNIGYTTSDAEAINNYINSSQSQYISLIKNQKAASSISMEPFVRENIKNVFAVQSFVIAPILPKEEDEGLFFIGTANIDTVITEGDEELITILANQIGQALENARLFEKTWQAQQDLEKRVEERTYELSCALEEVKKASKRKTDFVSSVTHELRTPLTSIKGYASILLSGKLGPLPEEARQRTEKINQHSDELARLVNDLLDISRIESGRIIMKHEPQNLKALAEEAGDLLSVQLKEKEIELTIDMPERTCIVIADKSQLERVFINLIGNAIKFTPPKGKINISCHKTGAQIQVDVSDTGCGIPPEEQGSVFEEFYRVDNQINQQVKGTGLGLTLVKHIVEAHKGTIRVKSNVNMGSSFSFTLPSGS